MNTQNKIDASTSYLQKTLVGYEVIPANYGWRIHKGDIYCGLLQYQGTKGWQGGALSYLSVEVREELKKFEQSNSSMPFLAA